MSISKEIARQITEMHFGGNWTDSNLKDQLADVDWNEANIRIKSFNSIATLAFHMNYYIKAALRVLEGNKLNAKDSKSFDHPVINSQDTWISAQENFWADAKSFATFIQDLPEDKLLQIFEEEKYGNYYRNLLGIIEHFHYHLGQIAFIKKMIKSR